jgi:hypothetical protein
MWVGAVVPTVHGLLDVSGSCLLRLLKDPSADS